MWSQGYRDPRVPLGAAFLLLIAITQMARRELKKSYKGIVVQRVVKALGNGLAYSSTSTFSKNHFHEMDLFDKRATRWKSEDEIRGRKDPVSYSVHEIRASYMEGSGKHKREVIIFQGVIIRLDFNKHFAGHTVILTNSQSQNASHA